MRRDFLVPLAGSPATCLLERGSVLQGSDSIESVSKWRLENIYSSDAWLTFWNQRSVISTELMGICNTSENELIAAIDHSISRQVLFLSHYMIAHYLIW
jgi:hypothetical protein